MLVKGILLLFGLTVLVSGCSALPVPISSAQWPVNRLVARQGRPVAELSDFWAIRRRKPSRLVLPQPDGDPELLVGRLGFPVVAVDDVNGCYVECNDLECAVGTRRESQPAPDRGCAGGAVVTCAGGDVILGCGDRFWTQSGAAWRTIFHRPWSVVAGLWQSESSHAYAMHDNLDTEEAVRQSGLIRLRMAPPGASQIEFTTQHPEGLCVAEGQMAQDGALWMLSWSPLARGGSISRVLRFDGRVLWPVLQVAGRGPGAMRITTFQVSDDRVWVAAAPAYARRVDSIWGVPVSPRAKYILMSSELSGGAMGRRGAQEWTSREIDLPLSLDDPHGGVFVTSIVVEGKHAWLGTSRQGVALVDVQSGEVEQWLFVGRGARQGFKVLDSESGLRRVPVFEWAKVDDGTAVLDGATNER